MGAFEFDRNRNRDREQRLDGIETLADDRCDPPIPIDPRRIREECIIAFKVYDHCRHPRCI